jgi:uncharacterized protein
MLQVVVIADDDSQAGWKAGSQADLLISCGDLWDQTIQRVCRSYLCRRAFAVRGNHDAATAFPPGIEDLHLTICEFQGLRFGGFRGCWRYKPRGNHLWDQWEVGELLREFPAVDVFVAHNSPRGIHEVDTGVHQGFQDFRDYIDRARPRFFIHGHQHIESTTRLGDTLIMGVYGESWITIV